MQRACEVLTKRRGSLAAVMVMVFLLSLVSHSRVQGMVVFNRCPMAQVFFSTVCWMAPASASLEPLPRARKCEAFFGQLTGLCAEQVKVEELHGAIRDTSAALLDLEAQLEKAKADLLNHEADYLLRQIATEQADEVAQKRVTEVSPESAAHQSDI
jgi:hypothetical protein